MADKRIIEVDDYQHGLILNALNDKRNELAEQGKTVVVISSGDASIYSMTPLIYEMRRERKSSV